jgi:hypothetical protein
MADERNEPAALVIHYLPTRGPKTAEIHEAWYVEASFNEFKSKCEAKKKHEYV